MFPLARHVEYGQSVTSQGPLVETRDVVLGCSGDAAPLIKFLEDFGGSSFFKCQVIKHLFKFSTLLLICKLILAFARNARVVPAGVTPFHAEILAANQPKFKRMLENLCRFIFALREDVLLRNQATCQRIL